MWRNYRQSTIQSSTPPVEAPPPIVIPGAPPPPPPPPPPLADQFPFKLYRNGVQIRESAALYKLVHPDDGGTAISGDTIKVAPGTYSPAAFNYFETAEHGNPPPGVGKAAVMVETLTIEWLIPGQRPVIDHSIQTSVVPGNAFFIGMGYTCTNLTVRGLDVRGAYVQSDNQACFIYGFSGLTAHGIERSSSAIPYTLTVEDCAMRDFTFGIQLSANANGVLIMRRCLVEAGLGGGVAPTLPHGVYAGEIARVDVTGCTFRRMAGAQKDAGHLLKMRARLANVHANFFDGRNAGIARCIGMENGGTLNCTGNIFMHGEADSNNDANGPIAFALEQEYPNTGAVFDGRTHSIFLAQNTIVWNQLNGFGFKLLSLPTISTSTPAVSYWDTAQSDFPLITASYLPDNAMGFARGGTINTIQLDTFAPNVPINSRILPRFGTGAAESGGAYRVIAYDNVNKIATIAINWVHGIPDVSTHYELISEVHFATITLTVRNNIASSALNSSTMGAQEFVATYPDNSKVNVSDIDNFGNLLLDPISGSPAISDALLEYGGILQQPSARSDTTRGAHAGYPAWRPGAGTIGDISLNTIGDVNPCPLNNCVYSPAEQQQGIFDWAGGGHIRNVDTYGRLVHWGGGHNGYYGNEGYEFSFVTRRWRLVRQPGLYGPLDDGFSGREQIVSAGGSAIPGYRVHTYAPGTFTPQPVYADEACTIPHANPLILDAGSQIPVAQVWTPAGLKYKWLVCAPGDTDPPSDPLIGVGAPNNRFINLWGEYDPGQPATPHPYRGTFGLPPEWGGGTQGSMVAILMTNPGRAGPNKSNAGSHRLDSATGIWTRFANTLAPFVPTYGPAAFDQVHGKFYVGEVGQASSSVSQQMAVLDCTTKNWTTLSAPMWSVQLQNLYTMDYCPSLDCLVRTESGGSGSSLTNPHVWTIPCNNMSEGWSRRSTNAFPTVGTGSTAGTGGPNPANDLPAGTAFLLNDCSINWAEALGKFGLFNGVPSDRTIFYLKPPAIINDTWLWSSETFTGTPNISGSINSGYRPTFNRMNWIAGLRSWSWYTSVAGSVQLWVPA